MKIGLEVEFFGKLAGTTDKIVNVGKYNIPHDEYPILAEARGQASNDVFQAVASVRGEIERITELMKTKGLEPVFVDWQKRDRDLEEEVLRQGLTKQISYQNLFSKRTSSKNKNNIAAGLHISLTEERSFSYTVKDDQSRSFTYNVLFDYPIIFNRIGQEFATEIKASGRVEGFYEVKGDGRVEYRSIPASAIHAPNFAARLNKCVFPVR
jgi:hypothetical protein